MSSLFQKTVLVSVIFSLLGVYKPTQAYSVPMIAGGTILAGAAGFYSLLMLGSQVHTFEAVGQLEYSRLADSVRSENWNERLGEENAESKMSDLCKGKLARKGHTYEETIAQYAKDIEVTPAAVEKLTFDQWITKRCWYLVFSKPSLFSKAGDLPTVLKQHFAVSGITTLAGIALIVAGFKKA